MLKCCRSTWLLAIVVTCFQSHVHADKTQQAKNQENPSPPILQIRGIEHSNSPCQQTILQHHIDSDVWVVSAPPKDGWDKAAFWISVALACIGIGGVVVGVMTLRFLRRQLILQYRPKIIVRFAEAREFNLADIGKPATAKVRFNIVNSGGSPCRITEGTVALWWTETSSSIPEKIQIHEGVQKQMGKFTLEPGQHYRWEETLEMNAVVDAQWVRYHKGIIAEDRRAIVLVGAIYYIDDLKIPRTTGIYRAYDPKSLSFIASDAEGEYSD